MHLLAKIYDCLFPPRVDEVILREVSIDDFLKIISPRLVPETRPGTVALFPFSDSRVRAAIHEAKYHGSDHAFKLLGSALSDYLRDCDDSGQRASNIKLIPIPLGKKRRADRGFNQVEEVAKQATKELSIEMTTNILTDLLLRKRETKSQVSLQRNKREKNMHGAFYIPLTLQAYVKNNPAHIYIILDDVLTTGATLQAAIDTLQKAGATHIIPLAFAH